MTGHPVQKFLWSHYFGRTAGETDAGDLAAAVAHRLPRPHRGEVPAAHEPRLPANIKVPHLHARHEPRLHSRHHLRLQDVQAILRKLELS